MDKEELKQRCLNVIEEHQDEIIALGKEAYKTPELGFKEFRTGKLMEEAFFKAWTGAGDRRILYRLPCVLRSQGKRAQGGGDGRAGLHHVRLPPGCS